MINEFKSLDLLAEEAERRGITISSLTTEYQAEALKITPTELREHMKRNLLIMRESIENGLKEKSSTSGLSGGLSGKLKNSDKGLLGSVSHRATVYALAVSEHNACMGRIVASPTAGSCGILPSVLFALSECLGVSEEKLIDGLINASAVGMVIASNATLAGAKGGCAAECGSAGAMAASAVCEIMGGTPKMCNNACALALKAVMGLVCDPVAGLVEVPCVKRNAFGAVQALTAAELALSGIESAIPVDEVIEAMRSVGNMMSETLKETSLGGIAVSKTAKKIERALKEKEVQYEKI